MRTASNPRLRLPLGWHQGGRQDGCRGRYGGRRRGCTDVAAEAATEWGTRLHRDAQRMRDDAGQGKELRAVGGVGVAVDGGGVPSLEGGCAQKNGADDASLTGARRLRPSRHHRCTASFEQRASMRQNVEFISVDATWRQNVNGSQTIASACVTVR